MNIVDSLVVTLGFDTSGMNKGQKDAAEITRKLKESTSKDASAVEEAIRRASTGVESLIRKFLSLYAVVTAGKGIEAFVSDLTTADSALGRVAKSIDVSARGLSTWQNAAVVAGGSAEGITGVMRSLSSELQRAALTGQSSITPAFRALGINLADTSGKARDVRDILTDMNRRAQGMDPARFAEIAKLGGIGDEATINMLEMSTAEFDKLIAAQERYAVTAEDVNAAQQRQSGFRELLITSAAIGRTVLTALTPAIVGAMKAVQDWANANEAWLRTEVVEKVGQFADYLKNVDWSALGKGVRDFAADLGTIAGAVASATKGLDGSSPLYKALEGIALLAGVRVVAAIGGAVKALTGFGAMPIPPALSALLLNPAVLGTAAVGAVLASGDPDKALLSGGKPDVQPQDNDLGLPGVGDDRPNDTTRPKGALDWIKANAMPDFGKAGHQFQAFLKATGFGDRLHEDPKTKENISDTARATKDIRDIVKSGASLTGAVGFDGVTQSTGGVGGSGRHADGTASPGASIGDRGDHRTWYQRHAPKALGGKDAPTGIMPEVADYIAREAAKRGIDPRVALQVAASEGARGYDPSKPDGGGDQGTSFGPFQLHYKSNIPGFRNAGMGDDFTRQTGKDARDSSTWKDQVGFALDHAAKHGWRNWHGWKGDATAGLGMDPAEASKLIPSPGKLTNDRPQTSAAQPNPQQPFADPSGMVSGDLSRQATYNHGALDSTKGLIFHHTGGRGSPEGVVDTLNQRGLGVQYVMDRDGKITRTLPEGARGAHILRSEINGLNNGNTQGVEVIAKDDKDVTPAQVAAGRAFAEAMAKRYPGLQVFGHGEVNPSHKQADEGRSIVEAYRAEAGKPTVDPNFKPAPIPIAQRTLQGYMGRDDAAASKLDPAPSLTMGHALRQVLRAMSHARKLTQHDGQPVSVEMTDRSATKLGERTFGAYVGWGKRHTDQLDQSRAILHRQAAGYGNMMRVAAAGPTNHISSSVSHVDRSTSMDVRGVTIHSAATNGKDLMSDLRDSLERRSDVHQAQTGTA